MAKERYALATNRPSQLLERVGLGEEHVVRMAAEHLADFLLDFGLYSLYNGGMEKLNPSKGNPETK